MLFLTFTDKADREDVLKTLHTLCTASGMQERKISFLSHVTDPFLLLDDSAIEEMLGVDIKPGTKIEEEKAKFSLFGKGRKK